MVRIQIAEPAWRHFSMCGRVIGGQGGHYPVNRQFCDEVGEGGRQEEVRALRMMAARDRLAVNRPAAPAMPGWVLALVFALLPAVAGATLSTRPADDVSEVNPETIEARIRLVEASTDLGESRRAELLSLYRQSLDQIKIASTWTDQAERLGRRRLQIPVELDEIRRRLEGAASQPALRPEIEGRPGRTPEELERGLRSAEEELKLARFALSRAEDDLQAWVDRRSSLPQKLSATAAQLGRVRVQLNALSPAGVDPEVLSARRTALLARRRALDQEARAYEQELDVYDAVGADLLMAWRNELKANVAQAAVRVDFWRDLTARGWEAETEREHRETQQQLVGAPAALHGWAEENHRLTGERRDVIRWRSEVSARTRAVEDLLSSVEEDFAVAQNRIKVAGMGTYIGPFLTKKRMQLPEIPIYERQIRVLEPSISSAQVRMTDLYDQREDLADLDGEVRRQLVKLRPLSAAGANTDLERPAGDLLRRRREILTALLKDYEAYWNDLNQLSLATGRLISRTQMFHDVINEHVLWMPSDPPLLRSRLPDRVGVPAGLAGALYGALRRDFRSYPLLYAGVGVLVAAWLGLYRPIRKHLARIDQRVGHTHTDSFGLTCRALLIDAYLAVAVPLALWFLGSRLELGLLGEDTPASRFARALALALSEVSLPLAAGLFLIRLMRPGGVAEAHFQWGVERTALLRRNLWWLTLGSVPLVFVSWLSMYRSTEDSIGGNSVGRIAFAVVMVMLVVFNRRILHPRYGILSTGSREGERRSVPRGRWPWYGLGVALPLAALGLSFIGYHYTATVLMRHFARTLYVLAALLAVRALMIRAVLVSSRKLALRRPEPGRVDDAGGALEREGRPAGEAVAAAAAADEPSVQQLGEQTRHLLNWLATLAFLACLWVIWRDVVPALEFVNRIQLWSYFTEAPRDQFAGGASSGAPIERVVVPVYLGDLLAALLLAATTIALATSGPNMLDALALGHVRRIDAGARFAIKSLLRYFLLVGGLVGAFGMIGIKWSQVQWLAAAITVGLGFGLQEIFANFVSGLIILFERPIRIGDTVTVGEISGKVSRIQIRATTVQSWDRKELIIPNKEFITGKVVNWTLSDSTLRLDIPVGIAYGSDTRLAERLLLKVAREHPLVLADPPPAALFCAFGESTLDFELRVFIGQSDSLMHVKHDLHRAIDDAFREAGIEIAFPQREVRVVAMPEPAPQRRADGPGDHGQNPA